MTISENKCLFSSFGQDFLVFNFGSCFSLGELKYLISMSSKVEIIYFVREVKSFTVLKS